MQRAGIEGHTQRPQPIRAFIGASVVAVGIQKLVLGILFVSTDLSAFQFSWMALPLLFGAAWWLAYPGRPVGVLPQWLFVALVGLLFSIVGNWLVVSPLAERDLRVDVELSTGNIDMICIADRCTSIDPAGPTAAFQADVSGRSVEVLVQSDNRQVVVRVNPRSGCVVLRSDSVNPAVVTACLPADT